MLKTIFIVAALYCLTVLCSCQKEIDSVTDVPVTDTGSQGYLPTTTGTFWVYKDSATNAYDTVTVLGDQTVINNITFTKVHTASATDENDSYYAINNHNYYLNGEQSGITLTMQVLNDTTAAGNGWVYDMGTINGIPAQGTGTIVEKLSSYAVQGETFFDVIHSHYVLAYNLGGTFTNFASYDFYFAKDKGIIKVQSDVADITGLGSDLIVTQELIDYDIK